MSILSEKQEEGLLEEEEDQNLKPATAKQLEIMSIFYDNLGEHPDGIEEKQLFHMVEEKLRKRGLKI